MKFLNLTFSILVFLNGRQVLAQEETSRVRAGSTLAVLEANLKDGFKLSDKAKKVIGLVTKPLGAKPHLIPPSALVNYGDHVGVYRLRNGWLKLIELQNNEVGKGAMLTSSAELKDDDEIATEGVALLRVSEMDAFGGEQ